MIFFLLVVTATFSPANPTVGDLITVQFEAPVRLEASPEYEIVSQSGNRVVLRTFKPLPFELEGVAGNTAFRSLIVPMSSVLGADDAMEPAGLKPPIAPARSTIPARAIGIAAVLAVLAWLGVFLLARRVARKEQRAPDLPASERFRLTIEELRRRPAAKRWALLADATRRYLVAIEPGLGSELTTSELLRKLSATNIAPQDVVSTILRQGDLEKFSPWGARPADFDATAQRALELIPAPVPAEEAA